MTPTVTVILPVRNAATTLDQQLGALAAQDYDGCWELLVVDNGSTDASAMVARSWSDRLPLRIIEATAKPGAAFARNRGVEAAGAELLLFCDADDIVAPGWLASLADTVGLRGHVAGAVDHRRFHPGAPSDVIHAALTTPFFGGDWLPFAIGANMALRRSLLLEAGGFDESLPSSEDKELSWRLQTMGHALHFEPRAVVFKRPRASAAGGFHQSYLWAFATAAIYRKLRHRGMPRSNVRFAVLEVWWVVTRAPAALVSRQVRRRWAERAGWRIGQVVGSLRWRVLYL